MGNWGSLMEFEWEKSLAKDRGIFAFDSADFRSRTFNLLRTRILKSMRAQGWRKLGIVSATPGAGKSFISLNLAGGLSRTADLQVVLLDLDLRKSTIAKTLGLDVSAGVSDFLEGRMARIEDMAGRLVGERLVIVPSRDTDQPSSSSELLASEKMKELVEWIDHRTGDALFICDMPPALANDDAAIIASHLDAFILVIDEGMTTKKQIKDTRNLLAPAVMAGSVLNRYRGGLIGDDYGYGYGYKGYGQYYS